MVHTIISQKQAMIDIQNSKKIVIITDLEPDDFLAIVLLFLSGMITGEMHFVVSAWQNVEHKCRCFRKFLQDSFPKYNNCSIYSGEPNKHNYILPLDFHSQEEFSSYREFDPSDSLIINLAPIRELMFYHKHDPNIFKNCELAIYGSFNIRSVLSEKKESPESVVSMFTSFSRVLLYESYWATGTNSSLADANILNIIRTKYPYLLDIIIWWNDSMKDECLQNCQNLSPDSASYQRNKMILDKIEAEPLQFVNADTGLAAILINPELQKYSVQGSITFDPTTFYTLVNEDIIGKITIIKCSDDSLLLEEIETFKNTF